MTEKNADKQQTPWLDADEIKTKVSIKDVLEKYNLYPHMTQKGNRISGKSIVMPGVDLYFSADLEKNIWNDFAGKPDGIPGNVIGLVQVLEKCSFREALVILHREFIAKTLETSETSEVGGEERKSSDEEKNASTENEPFGRELKGRTNIPSLLEKGIKEEASKSFGVVYCTSGLMKGRVAFPIRNTTGEVVAYAGRAVKSADEKNNGKYKLPNGFVKGKEIFNIDRLVHEPATRKAVKDFGIIVTVGFTDVMKLVQEGFPNTISIMGHEMSEEQRKLLLSPSINPTRRLTLFFDNDELGNSSKRQIAASLIHEGFVRYANWLGYDGNTVSPAELDKDALTAILKFDSSDRRTAQTSEK
ncbi:MAG: toprim domain-containing protein [Deltaproteobacteria bacterium]|nr:toprim domain-containing protein [Deltaproteobacteria bacterium]